MNRINIIFIGSIGLFLIGCKSAPTFNQAPNGFAPYSDSVPFMAISPDRVVYRVRVEKNKPFANLDFWKTALKKRMLDAGYHFVSDSSIKTQNNIGYLLELAAPVGNVDYMYVVALYLYEKSIIIIESGGELNDFKSHREHIIATINQLDVKSAVALGN